MGMIAYLVQVTTSVMVKMLTFLQMGLNLAGVLCFVSFESMDHMLLHFPLFFFGSCCTRILLVPMKLERFNFYAIQRIAVKEAIKLRKNNRELHRLASSCGVCTTLRNFIMR